MTWEIAAVLAAIVGVPLTIVGLVYVARQQARDQATARANEKQETYNKGFADGQANVAPDVNLMRSERDEARRQRDEERDEKKTALARIQELEDELRHGGSK